MAWFHNFFFFFFFFVFNFHIVLRPNHNTLPLIYSYVKRLTYSRYLDPKPIIKTQPPNTIVNPPVALLKKRRGSARKAKAPSRGVLDQQLISMDSDVINGLCKNATWNTTSQRTNAEATVPAVPVSRIFVVN